MTRYQHIQVPAEGHKITVNADMSLNVPDEPIIPFIEGDGIRCRHHPGDDQSGRCSGGQGLWRQRKSTGWKCLPAKSPPASMALGTWLLDETVHAIKDCVVSISRSLTTPVGGGIRSLNVTLRQELTLYVCLRPIQYFDGVPSPLKDPHKTNMAIFRENSEDIYAGIEFEAGSDNAKS